MELNNLEGISSWINSLTGGAKGGNLGDMSKLAGLFGTRGFGLGLGNKFPIILILLLIVLFGNRGGYGHNYPQQYACCCYKKKHRKHHRRCCCYENCCDRNQCCGYGGYGYSGYGSYGGFGGGNILFIIIILFLIRVGKRAYPLADNATGNIFNFNAADVADTRDENCDYTDANEEE